jgi:DNA-binding LacI/PurR family transcriptional regulator
LFKYRLIIQQLTDDIRELPAHTKLPSRKELCLRFHCTRTIVDRAIGELINTGHLYAHQGSGTYVAENEINRLRVSRTWALIVPDVMYSLYTAILRGVGDVAHKNDISVQIYNTDNKVLIQHEIIKRAVAANINGFIVVPAISIEPQHETFLFLSARKIPFVFCNRGIDTVPETPLVSTNWFYGGYYATRHLLQKNYRRPAIISHLHYRVSIERMQGYFAAIMEAGLKLNRRYVIHKCEAVEPLGYQETRDLLALPEPPDSIFCSSEYTLSGVYKAIADAGLRVSADIGIISHDNSSLCVQQSPYTTAVTFPAYEAGHQAAILLKKLMDGEKLPDFNMYILHPEFVERQSCLGPGIQG